MITVIDLKISNIASVNQALKRLGIEHKVVDSPEGLRGCSKIILAGVGSFYAAMQRMYNCGLKEVVRKEVIENKKPILGICLGMQLLASWGEEGGETKGLELIEARISYHRAHRHNLRLPHIGWNDVHYDGFKMFTDIPNDSCFYFVHSYEFRPQERVDIAISKYGVDFIAAVQKEHIIGVQFHPEKSQRVGLKLLDNFCKGVF